MKNKNISCEVCSECEYIGEGTFVCMKCMPPLVVMEDYTPTDDFGNCPKAEQRKNRVIKGR